MGTHTIFESDFDCLTDSNYVVRDFKSHGMRALAQNVQRTRNKERTERPFLEGVDHSMSEMKIWRRGEAEVFGRGETIFTEGTFVTWDIDAPPIEKLRIEDYLGEHEDIIKHHISPWAEFNSPKKCDGMPQVDYYEAVKRVTTEKGALPQVSVFRGQAHDKLSFNRENTSFVINKQEAACRMRPEGKTTSPGGSGSVPGARGFYREADTEQIHKELVKIPK